MARRLLFAFLTAATISGFLFAVSPNALAVSAADWRAGNIIDDSLFYDNNSMNVDEIQSFLNSKNPSCDTWGTQPATEKGYPNLTHAQYASKVGWPAPPYICLKDYYQVPRSDVIESNFNPTASKPAGSISAATIIKNAADTYGVSPKALLVLLHKESAGPLTVDTWPLLSQYKNAMGYACPDTAPCDPQYAGFYNQMTNAARRIQTYKQYPNSYRHQPYAMNNMVYYNPRLAAVDQGGCGWSPVYISGYATAGLYNYTPYQPNQAALNNLYGTGDDCSAYGNRNFWRLYNDWFGPTTNHFVKFDTPRWMEITQDTTKVDTLSGAAIDNTLVAGTQLRFVDKIYENGKWYYRTQWDSENGQYKAVDSAYVSDIQYTNFDEPRYMMTTAGMNKISPASGKTQNYFISNTYALFNSKIYVNGKLYYRTAFDTANNNDQAFPAEFVSDIIFQSLETPRYMRAVSASPAQNLRTNSLSYSAEGNTDYFIKDKVLLNGKWYYRTQQDYDNSQPTVIGAESFKEILFSKMNKPYIIRMTAQSSKFNHLTGQAVAESSLTLGQNIKVSEVIEVASVKYYKTEFDQVNGLAGRAIKVTETAPEVLTYVKLDTPRSIETMTQVYKTDLKTGLPTGDPLAAGRSLHYVTKTEIAGKWYLRTEFDTAYNLNYGVPIDSLKL